MKIVTAYKARNDHRRDGEKAFKSIKANNLGRNCINYFCSSIQM